MRERDYWIAHQVSILFQNSVLASACSHSHSVSKIIYTNKTCLSFHSRPDWKECWYVASRKKSHGWGIYSRLNNNHLRIYIMIDQLRSKDTDSTSINYGFKVRRRDEEYKVVIERWKAYDGQGIWVSFIVVKLMTLTVNVSFLNDQPFV